MADIEEPSADEGECYCLSKVIQAHKGDVKTLALTDSGNIISAGKDGAICFWTKKGGEYVVALRLQQPKDMFVNSLAYVDDVGDGWRLFAGRKDGAIAMYGSGSTEPMQVFKEHRLNVCCLHVCVKNGVLMSGSWDTDIYLWPIRELNNSQFSAHRLTGHELSVWALAAFPERPDHYLSASADKTIRLWHHTETLRIFKGHEDVVRALIVVSNSHFISAGNDGFVRYWDVGSGTCLGKFKTKTHDFIYSMTATKNLLLTTGEAGTLEFWNVKGIENDGQLLNIESESVCQTPSTSTWDVKVLPTTDIAVAASDGRIYILTKSVSRRATAEISEAFDAECVVKLTKEASRKGEDDITVIKVSLFDDEVPNMELKYKKGSDPDEAARVFCQEYNISDEYVDQVSHYLCKHVPAARIAKYGALRTETKANGGEYDFICQRDTSGGRRLRIPYNSGEDPDVIAQRFVEKHNLEVSLLADIPQWIREDVQQRLAEHFDPLTGSGRYVPGASGQGGSAAYSDPLTGDGRYVPGQPAPKKGYLGFDQHLTRPLTRKDKLTPASPHVPILRVYLSETYSEKAIEKLKEINMKQEDLKLNKDQLEKLIEMFKANPTEDFTSQTVLNALEMTLQWPLNDLAPVFDVFRRAILHKGVNAHFCDKTHGPELINRFEAILLSETSDPAVKVFLCRAIGNAFNHNVGAKLFALSDVNTLGTLIARQMHEPKHAKIAAVTALTNWAHALDNLSKTCDQLGPMEDLLKVMFTALENIPSFSDWSADATFKVMQIFGTLMFGNESRIKYARDRNILKLVGRMTAAFPSPAADHVNEVIHDMVSAVD